MSNEAIAWAFKQEGLTMAEKFVLIALADYANEAHMCFPAHEKTANRVAASRSTVKRAVKSLEQKGLLRVVSWHRPNGSDTSNRYQLSVGGQYEPPGQCEPGEGFTVDRGGGQCEPGARVTSEPPITLSSYPPTEPPVEPTHQRLDIATLNAPDEDTFDQWWDMYPVKVGKATARKAYRKAALRHGDLTGKLQAYLQHRARHEGQGWLPNIPHPTTWLNQERWDDRPMPTTDSSRPTAEQRFRQTLAMGQQLMDTPAQGELE